MREKIGGGSEKIVASAFKKKNKQATFYFKILLDSQVSCQVSTEECLCTPHPVSPDAGLA